MRVSPKQISHKHVGYTLAKEALWVALGVAVAAALAILAISKWALPPQAVTVPVVQSVPDAASQGVNGYIIAHGVAQLDTAPDIRRRAERDAALKVQVVPEAAAQGVAGYLRAHGAGSLIIRQSVPDAAAQGVAAYLRAHGVGMLQPAVVDQSFHTPQTSDYPGANSRFSPQPTLPDTCQNVRGTC